MSAPTRIRADRVADYVKLIETFAPVASYFTVNVSSPNTPGLRNLQQAGALDDLLAKVIDARERVRAERRRFAGAAQDRAGSELWPNSTMSCTSRARAGSTA